MRLKIVAAYLKFTLIDRVEMILQWGLTTYFIGVLPHLRYMCPTSRASPNINPQAAGAHTPIKYLENLKG